MPELQAFFLVKTFIQRGQSTTKQEIANRKIQITMSSEVLTTPIEQC